MNEKIKPLVSLAHQHGVLMGQYEKSVRSYLDQCEALDGADFWPMVDQLATAVTKNHRGLTNSKGAIEEFVRSRLFDNGHRFLGAQRDHERYWANQRLATWQRLAEFVRAYRKVKTGLSRLAHDWDDLDMGDDTFSDFVDSLVLGGKTRCQLINDRTIASRKQLAVNLFQHPLENFILHQNENYIEMSLIEALTEKLPTIAHDFFDDHGEKVEKDPPSVVEDCMDLQAIVDALVPVMEKTTRPYPGHVQINLTTEEHEALVKVAQMFQLADLVNYKRAQDSFPRLLNAVKLVLAIADNPEQNPTEKISLASKTRAQLDSALKFAEKL